jgi:hypothetical protein
MSFEPYPVGVRARLSHDPSTELGFVKPGGARDWDMLVRRRSTRAKGAADGRGRRKSSRASRRWPRCACTPPARTCSRCRPAPCCGRPRAHSAQARLDELHPLCHPFLRWLMSSNRAHLAILPKHKVASAAEWCWRRRC